jgi:hypothetical protein
MRWKEKKRKRTEIINGGVITVQKDEGKERGKTSECRLTDEFSVPSSLKGCGAL